MALLLIFYFWRITRKWKAHFDWLRWLTDDESPSLSFSCSGSPRYQTTHSPELRLWQLLKNESALDAKNTYTINDIETEIKRIYFITPWPDVRQDPQTVMRCPRARLDTMRIWGIRCIFLLSFCCPEDLRLLLLLLLPGERLVLRRDGTGTWVIVVE